jgi:hypothetical protein
MKHSDFTLGCKFVIMQGSRRRYRCTDIGKRTVVAIEIDDREDLSWFNGPPYAVKEFAFDEFDIAVADPFADDK